MFNLIQNTAPISSTEFKKYSVRLCISRIEYQYFIVENVQAESAEQAKDFITAIVEENNYNAEDFLYHEDNEIEGQQTWYSHGIDSDQVELTISDVNEMDGE